MRNLMVPFDISLSPWTIPPPNPPLLQRTCLLWTQSKKQEPDFGCSQTPNAIIHLITASISVGFFFPQTQLGVEPHINAIIQEMSTAVVQNMNNFEMLLLFSLFSSLLWSKTKVLCSYTVYTHVIL